ncbi:MAG: peptide ABC transporter substrate-binding protein [Oscillospiraceae bacterium]|nr:peptide ABC transporter substrate-binding protein [Oscillospiraceae bacterium]
MKKAFSVFLCILLIVCLFSSCKKSDIKALYFAVNGSSSSFDPQIAEDGAVSIVVRNCFEGLVYIDENGKAIPGAAERWEISPDGLTYTFYLRSGNLWHLSNTSKKELGEKLPADFAPEVTAYDFEFALKRASDPVTGSKDAYLLSNITGFDEIASLEADTDSLGVTAADKYTLKISLKEPEAGFLETLSEPVCMPCNEVFFEATGGRYGLLIKYIMSNGPFYLTRFDDNAFRMAKNPDYSGEHAAKTDVIWLYSSVDGEKLKEKLSDKLYSGALVSEYDCDTLNIKNSYNLTVPNILRAFIFNSANPDLANKKIRSAFIAATDPSILCSDFNMEKVNSLYPFSSGYSSAYKNAFSESEAVSLIEEGLDELQKTDLSFSLLCEERFDNSLRRLLQVWQQIFGIHISVGIEAVSADELEKRVKSGDYDIALYPIKSEYFAPFAYFSQFSVSDKNSLCFIESEELDSAVSALRFTASADYSSRLREAENLLIDSAAVLPIWQENSCLICLGGVSGVHYLGGGSRLYFYDAISE